mgnify:CR=1
MIYYIGFKRGLDAAPLRVRLFSGFTIDTIDSVNISNARRCGVFLELAADHREVNKQNRNDNSARAT